MERGDDFYYVVPRVWWPAIPACPGPRHAWVHDDLQKARSWEEGSGTWMVQEKCFLTGGS